MNAFGRTVFLLGLCVCGVGGVVQMAQGTISIAIPMFLLYFGCAWGHDYLMDKSQA